MVCMKEVRSSTSSRIEDHDERVRDRFPYLLGGGTSGTSEFRTEMATGDHLVTTIPIIRISVCSFPFVTRRETVMNLV